MIQYQHRNKNYKMGFNKRYISEDVIRLIANSDDVERFFNYFKSDHIN